MHLDCRELDREQGVTERYARVTISAGVNHDPRRPASSVMKGVDQHTFMVTLLTTDAQAKLWRERREARDKHVICDVTIDVGLS
jgi:hypothetical protein